MNHHNIHASRSLSLLILLSFASFWAEASGNRLDLHFAKGGVYCIRVNRIPGLVTDGPALSGDASTLISQPDKSDTHLLFSRPDDYRQIYSDSLSGIPDFESTQILKGVAHDTGGRKSVHVIALNCKTVGMYQTFADQNGNFEIDVTQFADSTVFNIDAYDELDKRKSYEVSLTERPAPDIPRPSTLDIADNTTEYSLSDTAIVLKKIEVTAKRPSVMNTFKIEPTRAYYEGDPAIYRHTNLSSLLRTLGIYNLKGMIILLDNMIIQKTTDTDEDYTYDENIESYLNSLNINDIWQVEYIAHDPRNMMFQAFHKGASALLIYTKTGVGGRRGLGSPLANSFTPAGYVPNIVNRPRDNEGDLVLWRPEITVKDNETLKLNIEGTGRQELLLSVSGITTDGEFIEYSAVMADTVAGGYSQSNQQQ